MREGRIERGFRAVVADRRLAACVAALALAAVTTVLSAALLPQRSPAESPPPNIVLVLTDDMRSGDLAHMPQVNRLLVGRGTTFPNFTTTTPACCPSRATFLRGQYAHNHRVGHGEPGRESTFRENRLDRSTVATWLDNAGYATWFVGKYLNSYEVRRVPPGWAHFEANFDRNNWARKFNANGVLNRIARGNADAHLGRLGLELVKRHRGNRPFFLFQSFNAPHRDRGGPPPAPARELARLADEKAPRTAAFNRRGDDTPPHLADLPKLSRDQIRAINIEHRARLASLQVVDRAVRRLVRALRDAGQLGNTYFFFTSDNGYHLGEHRLPRGKMTSLLTDVRVPLIVRGPGIDKGAVRYDLVQSTDIAPTFADIGAASIPDFVDGRSLLPLVGDHEPPRTATLFEGKTPDWPKPMIRKFVGLTTADGFHYAEYPDGFRELYDLNRDPDQMRNLANEAAEAARVAQLRHRLDSLRSCSGPACRSAENGP